MKSRHLIIRNLPTLALCFLGVSMSASSQTSREQAVERGTGVIEEIIVTARKREESLQDVPVAITALSSRGLEKRGIDNLIDVAAATPSLISSVGAAGGSSAQYYIRGVGQIDFNIATDPGVATYLDGVYLGRVTGAALDLMDVERVEVLRGPQGTLFGRNALGGALSVVTAKPSSEFEGKVTLGAGSRNRLFAKAELNAVVVPNVFSAKVALLHEEQDGYVERISDDKTFGDKELDAGRIAFWYTPAETLELYLTADYTQSRGTADGHQLIAVADGSQGAPPVIVAAASGWEPFIVEDGSEKTHAGFLAPDDLDAGGVALTADWHLWPSLSIKSITAFREQKLESGIDFDGSPRNDIDQANNIDQDQFSQEFQFKGSLMEGRLETVAGLFYYREDADQHIPIEFFGSLLVDRLELEVTSYAAFFTGDYRWTDKWSTSFGLRYSYEEKKHLIAQTFGTMQTVPPTELEDDWDSVTPKLSVDYQPSDAVLVYLSYTEGFRSGGINARVTAGEPETFNSYDPETLSTWELGFKTEGFNNRLRLNGALFYSRYEDIQLTLLSAGASGAPIVFTDNAAEAEVRGVELEFQFAPMAILSFDGGISFTENEYKDLESGSVVDEDDKLASLPRWQIAVGAEYIAPFTLANGEVLLRADYSYTSEYHYYPVNNPLDENDAYSLVNLRAAWAQPNGNWGVALYGKNVLDEEYSSFRADYRDSFGPALNWPGKPAEWGLEVQYRL